MKIAIANDHSAVELKNIIKEHLESKGYEVLNLGTDSTESCDYPVYGEKVGRAVADGEADIGIAGGKGEGLLIKKGEIIQKLPEDQLLNALREELLNWEK